MGELVRSKEYDSFRSSVPQKKIIVDHDDKAWTIYDAGPKGVKCPLICLPPASGRADVFFLQILSLTGAGYRVIAVEYPVYWTLKDWCEGFRKLVLDHLHLKKVHLFGASLGGFLAQKFAEYTCNSPLVHSMVLCNSFVDTTIFQQTSSAPTFWMMPALVLKKMVMGNFENGKLQKDIADSIDFMVTSLDALGQQELASRLTLNCMNAYVEPQKLKSIEYVTLMDVYDECALSQAVKEEMYKCYPNARRALLKNGGNFPYLSKADEVNIYLQVHLKEFWETEYSAMERPDEDQENNYTGTGNSPPDSANSATFSSVTG